MTKKIIGLTGGIGSGKSTVARLIEAEGYPVYTSDTRAKELVDENTELRARITSLLGAEAYDGGKYNRKFVAEKIFNDDELRQQLNAIIHPAVRRDFESWLEAQDAEFLFQETALLFELKLNEGCYKSVLVTADDNLRLKRVMDRDGKTYREALAVMDSQMPEKEKLKISDYVIYNNSDFENLKQETLEFLRNLTAEN